MDYMIINGFNTSSLPGCVVTDFGKVEAAKPKGEKATLYGVNGSYRVLDGSFDSYERTFTLHVKKMVEISSILDKFQSNDNVLEFSYQLDSLFYANFVTASFEPFGNACLEDRCQANHATLPLSKNCRTCGSYGIWYNQQSWDDLF